MGRKKALKKQESVITWTPREKPTMYAVAPNGLVISVNSRQEAIQRLGRDRG